MEYNVFLEVESRDGKIHKLNSVFPSREIAITQYNDAISNIKCFFAINNTLYKLNGSVQIELISIPDWPFNIKSIHGNIEPATNQKFKINHLPVLKKLTE